MAKYFSKHVVNFSLTPKSSFLKKVLLEIIQHIIKNFVEFIISLLRIESTHRLKLIYICIYTVITLIIHVELGKLTKKFSWRFKIFC
ncbi:hypothetical protein ANTRET_LOCUS1415 [Anthophora retusa]